MKKNKFLIKLGERIMILVVVLLLAIVAARYLINNIKRLNLTMQENKKASYLLENRERINKEIEKNFAAVDQNYDKKVSAALPSIYNVLPFVEALESLAKKNSLQQTISFGQPLPASNAPGPLSLVSLDFNVSLTGGNIDSLTAYLKDLEKLAYFTDINSISLNSASNWQDNSSISLSGRLYAQQ